MGGLARAVDVSMPSYAPDVAPDLIPPRRAVRRTAPSSLAKWPKSRLDPVANRDLAHQRHAGVAVE
jgi:hypothetical protein